MLTKQILHKGPLKLLHRILIAVAAFILFALILAVPLTIYHMDPSSSSNNTSPGKVNTILKENNIKLIYRISVFQLIANGALGTNGEFVARLARMVFS